MTALAEKSLDLQYYIWEADTTGRILALRLTEAADRGVRVRILVDGNNITGRDSPIASLDAHPNIEIRIFNRFAHRGSRLFGDLTDFSRLNHRMHNKVIVAGYAKYRKSLIEAGVEMYELCSDSVSPTVVGKKIVAGGESKAALHTKAIVFDHASIFVGSFNLDPRSANINTEIGLYVENPELIM